VRVATAALPGAHGGAFVDVTDPTAERCLEIAWHADAPAGGQVVARVTPRVVADAELASFGDLTLSGGGDAALPRIVTVAGGTALALLETL
jgi:hypothetical protein